ncbi:hypothetical protein SAMD00019534_041870 [Acytostelium subglobosum LB1]|uniref:hypothetical protein n=1 Tax=Acytostelium subglobosum LB1 TaxID=1410327 RepID=UPI000644B850|nr:hypothetical protein SAMD00019534_041870 [Acytostelium subglobosum LB1]GAM21012.1 hypothetical protein SAMD00019534_041870 [Acytostelium subglobosum LB1]|eukprot:XP_012756146.1 hypothetical protein SAMD00019534_041870 [Acytostelium subglobosum LB1]
MLWNNKFELAESTLKKKASSHPRYSLHHAETIFLRSFITADVNDTEQALARLKDTREMAETYIKYLDSNKLPPSSNLILKSKEDFKNSLLDCKIVLGDSLYMIAVLQLTRDYKFKGCFNMRRSWKTFEDALSQVKDGHKYNEQLLECLHFGVGFFLYAMSIIPQKFLRLVEFVGFKADREQGMQYIKHCGTNGGIRAPFANMVLLFNNLLLPRGLYNPTKHLREAELVIQDNMKRYPEGSLFQVMASHCYRKQCRIEEGLACMVKALDNCATFQRPPLIYSYELANCYVIMLDWPKAIEVFERLVKEESFQIRALCGLQLASCYFACGLRSKGEEALSKVKSFAKRSSSVEPICVRQAARYAQNGGYFSAFEIMYIRRDLAKMEKGNAERVLEALQQTASKLSVLNPIPIPTTASSSGNSFFSKAWSFGQSKKGSEATLSTCGSTSEMLNDRIAYMMMRGATLKSMDRIDEALTCFEEVVKLHPHAIEKFYYPYCLYEMSESHFHRKNHEQTLEYLKRCNAISGYDWEDPLKIRLRVTMDQIKKDGASVGDDWGEEDLQSDSRSTQ